MPNLRILVTGGRNYTDRPAVNRALRSFEQLVFGFQPEEIVLVHGDCKQYDENGNFDPDRSADQLAAQEAEKLGWTPEPHPVKKVHYDRWSKAAPLKRNEYMVRLGAHYLVAFPGGNGTAHCRRLALNARIPVIDIPEGHHG